MRVSLRHCWGYYPSNRRATTIYKTRVTNRLNRPRHEGDRIETLYTG